MRKVIAIFLAILFLSSILPIKDAFSQDGDFVLGIYLDKTSYNIGETVEFVFTITNKTNSNHELTFNTSQIYNFIIYKDEGIVYSWALNKAFAQVITTLKFEPGETKAYIEKWDLKDNSGNPLRDGVYIVEFSLKTSPLNEGKTGSSISREFLVGNVPFEPIFNDVSDYFIAKHLKILSERGIVKGYPDGTFQGENILSRAEAVALVARIKGNPMDSFTNNTFIDVTPEHWAFNYVEWAVKYGLISGKTSSMFEPNFPITKAEFVSIVAKALAIVPQYETIPSPFADLAESYPGENLIVGAFNCGVIMGSEVKDGKLYFYPESTINRNEAILIISRALEITGS